MAARSKIEQSLDCSEFAEGAPTHPSLPSPPHPPPLLSGRTGWSSLRALDPDWGRHAIVDLNEVCHRKASLMAVPCVATLDFAGGSDLDGLLGTSLPVTHSCQPRTTAKSVAQRSVRHPPASGRERHDRALGTPEEADDKSVEADLHGEPGRSARFL